MKLEEVKCWSCWWREGSRCFSEDFGDIPRQEDSEFFHTKDCICYKGHEITPEHIKKCKTSYDNKRTILGSIIPNDLLYIASEREEK